MFLCVLGCNPNPTNLNLNPPLPVTGRGGFQVKICWAGSVPPCLSRAVRAFFKYKYKNVQHPHLKRLCLTTFSSHNEHTDRNSLQQVGKGGVRYGIKNAGNHVCSAEGRPEPGHLSMSVGSCQMLEPSGTKLSPSRNQAKS